MKLIAEMILEILNENSGGMKFTDLLVQLVSRMYEQDEPVADDFPDQIESIIREQLFAEVKILEYMWKPERRHKMFVYTP